MNITKFLRVSKKKDLSDELDGGEQQKKVRKEVQKRQIG